MDTGRHGARTRARRFALAALVAAGICDAAGAAAQEAGSITGGAAVSRMGGGHGTRAELTLRRATPPGDSGRASRQSIFLVRDGSPLAEFGLRAGIAVSRAAAGGAAAKLGGRRRPGGGVPERARPAPADAGALRLAAAHERRADRWLHGAPAFLRWSDAGDALRWTVALDPALRASEHDAYGAALEVRRDVVRERLRLALGADVESSPGRDARSIAPRSAARTAAAAQSARDGVAFRGAAAYLRVEAGPVDGLRLAGTLRHDRVRYGYRARLADERGSADLARGSIGGGIAAEYAAGGALELAASWQSALRAPAEKMVLLHGRAGHGPGLEPVRVEQARARVRGRAGAWLGYEAGVYHEVRRHDVVTLTHADGRTELVNAPVTRHRRVEAAVAVAPLPALRLDVAYVLARHTYGALAARAGGDAGGNEVESAPRGIGSVRVTWAPGALRGAAASLEWTRVGPCWMDAGNTRRYPGHDLLDARVRVPVAGRVALLARAVDVLDDAARPAPLARVPLRGEEWAPWMRRTVAIGLEVR